MKSEQAKWMTTPAPVRGEIVRQIGDALRLKKYEVIKNYYLTMEAVKNILNREGRVYAFGPTPVVWSRKVWESLHHNYLLMNNMSIMDAICKVPFELCWYGEALLKYQSIRLLPVESFFKVYHYKWQYDENDLKHPRIDLLKHSYLGIIKQSNWNRKTKYIGKIKKLIGLDD
jgi:hypothetical protein